MCLLSTRSSTSRSWPFLKNWTDGRKRCYTASGDPKSPFLGSKFTRSSLFSLSNCMKAVPLHCVIPVT